MSTAPRPETEIDCAARETATRAGTGDAPAPPCPAARGRWPAAGGGGRDLMCGPRLVPLPASAAKRSAADRIVPPREIQDRAERGCGLAAARSAVALLYWIDHTLRNVARPHFPSGASVLRVAPAVAAHLRRYLRITDLLSDEDFLLYCGIYIFADPAVPAQQPRFETYPQT